MNENQNEIDETMKKTMNRNNEIEIWISPCRDDPWWRCNRFCGWCRLAEDRSWRLRHRPLTRSGAPRPTWLDSTQVNSPIRLRDCETRWGGDWGRRKPSPNRFIYIKSNIFFIFSLHFWIKSNLNFLFLFVFILFFIFL